MQLSFVVEPTTETLAYERTIPPAGFAFGVMTITAKTPLSVYAACGGDCGLRSTNNPTARPAGLAPDAVSGSHGGKHRFPQPTQLILPSELRRSPWYSITVV